MQKKKKPTSKNKHCYIVSRQFQTTSIKMKPIFPWILVPKCPTQMAPGQCRNGDFLTILSVLPSMPYRAQHQLLPFPHKYDLAEQQHHPLPRPLFQQGQGCSQVTTRAAQPSPAKASHTAPREHKHLPAEITQVMLSNGNQAKLET